MATAVVTRREADTHKFNRRGYRTGIVGTSLDSATGSELSRQARVFGVKRERARLLGFRMPWGESDESLRRRAFVAFQMEHAPPPCVHNVWAGYDTYTKCDDCGEVLYVPLESELKDMVLFITRLHGNPHTDPATGKGEG